MVMRNGEDLQKVPLVMYIFSVHVLVKSLSTRELQATGFYLDARSFWEYEERFGNKPLTHGAVKSLQRLTHQEGQVSFVVQNIDIKG